MMKVGSKLNGPSLRSMAAHRDTSIGSRQWACGKHAGLLRSPPRERGLSARQLRSEMQGFFHLQLVRVLNRCMLILLPKNRGEWGQALIAEQEEINDRHEILRWAAGGIAMSIHEFFTDVFDKPYIWALGSVLALAAALLDLHSSSRWPYVSALFCVALLLTLLQPKRAWRWTLLAAFILPAFVLISGHWGPYAVDRFDVFYGLVPAAIGTLIGVGLRSGLSQLRVGTIK